MSQTNGDSKPMPLSAGHRLRALLTKPGIISSPGVYDGITARLALHAKFPALYMTGAGTSMSRLGLADLGYTNLSDMVANAATIAALDRRVPVIADADTGYGGPLMVARTVREYMAAGVAGLHLEDQIIAKRCGHLGGKELVDEGTFLVRIRAAVLAREEMRELTGGDIVIIARTDALQSLGYKAAVERLRKALAEGADVAFLEGMTTMEQCESVCRDLCPAPVLLNMVAGGITPLLSVEEAERLKFKIIIFPTVALGPVTEVVEQAMMELKKTGKADVSETQRAGGVKRLFEICGMAESVAFDASAGSTSYEKGVL